ncbi:MAG TPA: response regulator [Gammaproteobacteria bacterium]
MTAPKPDPQSGQRRLLLEQTSRYAIYGTGIAAVGVIVGTLLVAWYQHGGLSIDAIALAQTGDVGLWALDGMPFFFAAWGQYASIQLARQADSVIENSTRDLRDALQRAEYTSQAKSDFFAKVSHELRSPINGILGMSDLLMGGRLDGEQQKRVQVIHSAAGDLLNLINDILDYSRIEAGKLQLESIEFDVHECIEGAVMLLAQQAQAKGLELTVVVQPDMPRRLIGDPGRLRQMIINLLSNAIKFTERGEVVLSAKLLARQPDGLIMIRIEVADTGIGVSRKALPGLFQPYTQSSSATTRKHGGTGLGLAITRELAETMHGDVGAESEEGRGSRFWFSVRLNVPEHAYQAAAGVVIVEDLNILVVAANDDARHAFADQLRALGCDVEEATDGIEGLQYALRSIEQHRPFHLVFTDMFLPHLDGESLGRELKARPETRHMVLSMQTNTGARGDAARLHEAGFAGYFSTRIPPAELRETVVALMATRDLSVAERARHGLVTRYTLTEKRRDARRVLLVDDSPVDQEITLALLGREGCITDIAVSGREAVSAVQRAMYSVVVLDMQLPDMSGIEVASRIRNLPGDGGRVPIVVLTAGLTDAERKRVRDAGANDVLLKPVEAVLFRRALARFVAISTQPEAETQAQKDKQLIDLFCRESERRVAAMRIALRDGEFQSIAREAHTMKGITAHVDAGSMRVIAMRLEELARSGVPNDAIGAAIDALEQAFAAYRDTLAAQNAETTQPVR